jgi:hypothetical protein
MRVVSEFVGGNPRGAHVFFFELAGDFRPDFRLNVFWRRIKAHAAIPFF